VGCVQARVSEWSLSTLLNPILELQHAPLPLKVLWARERAPTPPSSTIFYLDSHLSPSRSWECVTRFSFQMMWCHELPSSVAFFFVLKTHICKFEILNCLHFPWIPFNIWCLNLLWCSLFSSWWQLMIVLCFQVDDNFFLMP